MPFFVLIFALIVIGILGGSHWFLYYSLLKFFHIDQPSLKITFLVIFILLGSSFIIASGLAHWQENWFTRWFYIGASSWLGILANLFICMLLVWGIFFLQQHFEWKWNMSFVASVGIGCAIIVSVYGRWNAFHPVVKEITVYIKDLPAYWQNKKVVQLSDVHLGHVYQADFLQDIVNTVNTAHPEAVFITGDLFDGMDGQLSDLVAPLKNLVSIQGTFFITGNHEIYMGLDKAISLLKDSNIIHLNNMLQQKEGLQIIGIDYPSFGQSDDTKTILESLATYDKQKPSILLQHVPNNVQQAKEEGISLMLSGHTHKGQIWPLGYLTYLLFKGHDSGLATEGDFNIYTSVGVGTWGPPMRTGNNPEIVVITLHKK